LGFPITRIVAAELAGLHGVERVVIGFSFGLAIGIRLGRTFAPPPKSRSKWISDEYKRLTEPNRRDAQQYIRKLLKAQTPPTPRPSSTAEELAAAKRWIREAGRLGRREGRGFEDE
jgi:hypothetical protein